MIVVYFLAAIESGFLEDLPYEVELIFQEEYRNAFCYSIAECRASYPQAMDAANRFYQVNKCDYICMSRMNEDTEVFYEIYGLQID